MRYCKKGWIAREAQSISTEPTASKYTSGVWISYNSDLRFDIKKLIRFFKSILGILSNLLLMFSRFCSQLSSSFLKDSHIITGPQQLTSPQISHANGAGWAYWLHFTENIDRSTRYTKIWHSFSSPCEFLSPTDCWFGPVISILSQVIYPTWASKENTSSWCHRSKRDHYSSWTNDIGLTMELGLFNLDERRLGADPTAVFHSLKWVRAKTEPNSSQGQKNKAMATRLILIMVKFSPWEYSSSRTSCPTVCGPPSSEMFKTCQDVSLSKLLWLRGWLYFEQEVGSDNPWESLPTCGSVTGTTQLVRKLTCTTWATTQPTDRPGDKHS